MSDYNPHLLDALSFNTSAVELAEVKKIYEALVAGSSENAIKLGLLLDWVGQQRACEEAYNNTDFSP